MGIIGVTFGDKHSYYDWHVYLDGGLQISYPTPRRVTVDVAFRNGLLDVTSALMDRITYESREITIPFKVIDNPRSWQDLYSMISGDVHGKSLKVIYDMDPSFYWDAYNCVVTEPKGKEDIGEFSITCTCYPFKKEIMEKQVTVNLTGSTFTQEIENLREEIVPTITTTAAASLTFKGKTYQLETGENIITEVVLSEGTNLLRFNKGSSNATITIAYRRGEL